MTVRSFRGFTPWLDVVALATWGVLLLKYAVTGKLYLLIHPNYMGLTVVSAITLLILAGWKVWDITQRSRRFSPDGSHITLLPVGWGSTLLIVTAIAGLVITPRAFASQTAIQRGVTDAPTLTRVKPQAFRGTENSEDKSIIDWVRTLTVYPEPDAYTGQKAKVKGFVIHSKTLPDQYLLISRFVLTCCAADAYPVSLPVKLSQSRDTYKPDTWLEIEGNMITETVGDKRQLVIAAKKLTPISEPKNPYDY